jgi:hypothetical protein
MPVLSALFSHIVDISFVYKFNTASFFCDFATLREVCTVTARAEIQA